MSHRFRVSTATQTAVIEDALKVYNEMKTHLESCTVCGDDVFCTIGAEIWTRLSEVQRRLKRIGYEDL